MESQAVGVPAAQTEQAYERTPDEAAPKTPVMNDGVRWATPATVGRSRVGGNGGKGTNTPAHVAEGS
jgi:hypothetical protein